MFEAAELGHKLSKGQYKRIEPKLRVGPNEDPAPISTRRKSVVALRQVRASEVAQDRGDADVGLARAEEAGRVLAGRLIPRWGR